MSKLLVGIKNLYIDSNILIYLVEGHADLGELVLTAFAEIYASEIKLITSEMTLMECLSGAFRSDNQELAAEYGKLFSQPNFIRQISVEREILLLAAQTRGQTKLKSIDAIHMSTAELLKCDGLLTNDKAFRSIKGVKVVQLSQFED